MERTRRGITRACGPSLLAAGMVCLIACTSITRPADAQVATAPATGPAAASTSADVVQMVGPQLAKDMMDEVAAAQQASGQAAAKLDYLRIDAPSTAINHFLLNRQLLLTIGHVNDKALGASKARWSLLGPKEHLLAGRVLAIAVHASSEVQSLTPQQVQDIFSGRIANWKALGGPDKAIRRYGTNLPDEFARLFYEKVVPAARCAVITRKKDAADILQSLGGDPQGIAFLDASEVATSGAAVRMLPIGEAKDPTLPNAQTVKEGTYPFAEAIVLYVRPEADEAASRFAQFMLSEEGDAICRKHGLMPGLKPPKVDLAKVVDKLYGEDIKRVQATAEPDDDIALGKQILGSANSIKITPELLSIMCEAVFMLGSKAKGGDQVALDALQLLSESVPEKKFECAAKKATLFEAIYAADKLTGSAEALVDVLMDAAGLGTSSRQYVAASRLWKRAAEVSEQIRSSKLEVLKIRLPAFAAREKVPAQLESLKAQLKATPNSAIFRQQMLLMQLVEMDDPAEAAKYVERSDEETLKTNIPLAQTDVAKLNEQSSLKLAEWYLSLMNKGSEGGRELMAARAQGYYLKFFSLHKDRRDALAMQAQLGLKKAGGTLPEPPVKTTPTASGGPVVTKAANPMTDAQLAQLVVDSPDLTDLTQTQLGEASLIRNLRPLEKLTKLRRLILNQALQIKDISPLAKLTTLTELRISGAPVDDFSPIAKLQTLTTLCIGGSGSLSDLSVIAKLPKLEHLTLNSCPQVEKLSPLSSMTTLKGVALDYCSAVSDLSSLEGLPSLTGLSVNHCSKVKSISVATKLPKLASLNLDSTGVTDLSPLESCRSLKQVTVRLSDELTQAKIDRLQKKLPDCKITVMPAPSK